jgi:hypothetical protein
MKKTLLGVSICFALFSCVKNDNNSNNSGIHVSSRTGSDNYQISFSGTLVIGSTVRQFSDYSTLDLSHPSTTVPPLIYQINGSTVWSPEPVCTDMITSTGNNPNTSFYTIRMTDYRFDTISTIQFNTPLVGNFSTSDSFVYISIGGLSTTAIADISFSAVTNDGSGNFDLLGRAIISAGDTVPFSYKGSFTNLGR